MLTPKQIEIVTAFANHSAERLLEYIDETIHSNADGWEDYANDNGTNIECIIDIFWQFMQDVNRYFPNGK